MFALAGGSASIACWFGIEFWSCQPVTAISGLPAKTFDLPEIMEASVPVYYRLYWKDADANIILE